MNQMKHWVRSLFRQVGFEIYPITLRNDLHLQLTTSLRHFAIDSILDVGANCGQFGCAMRRAGFNGYLTSFEPLSAAHSRLIRAATGDSKWQVFDRVAMGSTAGEATIHVSANSQSSSLREILSAHTDAAPQSRVIGSETVPVIRLEEAMATLSDAQRQGCFLKIDTQGFEWEVLQGLGPWLEQVRGVVCELSLVPLYGGQKDWRTVVEWLHGEGFSLWSVHPGFTDERSGRNLQFDAVFFRN